MGVLAYLGGSFNPPHFGHLLMAKTVADRACADTFLMPSHNPFKDKASDDRLALLTLALDEFNAAQKTTLAIEKIEINSSTYPTYTLDTLQLLKANNPNDTLIFIIGQDSFDNLPNWKGGFELLKYCHLWVFGRGDDIPSGEFATLDELMTTSHGKIYWDNVKIPNISSTYIRNTLKTLWQNHAPLDDFYTQLSQILPKTVIDKIFSDKLYWA